jgi:hypothetical protein
MRRIQGDHALPQETRGPESDVDACRTFQPVADPDELVHELMILNAEQTLDDEWASEMASGRNFKIELVLHVDHLERKAHTGQQRWRARWLEVTRLYD